MIIGCNFIRSMQGGVRIEGTTVTFYKNLTVINTSPEVAAVIEEMNLEEEEYIAIKEAVFYNLEVSRKSFVNKFSSLIKQLEDAGFIGEDPLRHWSKNKVVCKLDIINPDFTIADKPLKHVTPQLQKVLKRHVQALLDLKVIQPSKSRHRTTALIVSSGTEIDQQMGK